MLFSYSCKRGRNRIERENFSLRLSVSVALKETESNVSLKVSLLEQFKHWRCWWCRWSWAYSTIMTVHLPQPGPVSSPGQLPRISGGWYPQWLCESGGAGCCTGGVMVGSKLEGFTISVLESPSFTMFTTSSPNDWQAPCESGLHPRSN